MNDSLTRLTVTGEYEVGFDQNVLACSYAVTIYEFLPPYSDAFPQSGVNDAVFVAIWSNAAVLENADFELSVFCLESTVLGWPAAGEDTRFLSSDLVELPEPVAPGSEDEGAETHSCKENRDTRLRNLRGAPQRRSEDGRESGIGEKEATERVLPCSNLPRHGLSNTYRTFTVTGPLSAARNLLLPSCLTPRRGNPTAPGLPLLPQANGARIHCGGPTGALEDPQVSPVVVAISGRRGLVLIPGKRDGVLSRLALSGLQVSDDQLREGTSCRDAERVPRRVTEFCAPGVLTDVAERRPRFTAWLDPPAARGHVIRSVAGGASAFGTP